MTIEVVLVGMILCVFVGVITGVIWRTLLMRH